VPQDDNTIGGLYALWHRQRVDEERRRLNRFEESLIGRDPAGVMHRMISRRIECQKEILAVLAGYEKPPNANGSTERVTHEQNVGDHLRMFCGWLSGDFPELHNVELPKLAESAERYLAAFATRR